MKHVAQEACAAFVGLDWADATHDVCLQAAGAERREVLVLAHRPEAIDAWVQTLRTRFHGHPVAVGLELNTGPMVSALRHSDFLGLFPVNLFTLAQYREAFTPRRAKDDPTDAALQVALLLTPRDTRTPLTPQSPTMRAVAQLLEHRRRRVGDTGRCTHRLPSALKNDFPHVLQWFQDKDTAIFCDFLSRWPTLTAAQLARRPTLAHVFRAHHVRSADVIKTRIEALKSAVALPTDAGVITPTALVVHALVAPLRGTVQALTACDNARADHAQSHPDCPLFDARPGAGPVFAPRLLVAFGAPRERDASAEDLQQDAGMAPVTARRGKKSSVHWRLPCPQVLRHTFVAWAAASLRPSCWAQAYYQQPRAQGQAHQAAVRA